MIRFRTAVIVGVLAWHTASAERDREERASLEVDGPLGGHTQLSYLGTCGGDDNPVEDDQEGFVEEPDPEAWTCPALEVGKEDEFRTKISVHQSLVAQACQKGCEGQLFKFVDKKDSKNYFYRWHVRIPPTPLVHAGATDGRPMLVDDRQESFEFIFRHAKVDKGWHLNNELLGPEKKKDGRGKNKFLVAKKDDAGKFYIQAKGFLLAVKQFWCLLGKKDWKEKALTFNEGEQTLKVWWDTQFESETTEEDKQILAEIFKAQREHAEQKYKKKLEERELQQQADWNARMETRCEMMVCEMNRIEKYYIKNGHLPDWKKVPYKDHTKAAQTKRQNMFGRKGQ